MSNRHTWNNTLKRTKDSLKNTYRRSRDFLSALGSVGDERKGFRLSKKRRITESTQMSEETSFQGKGQSDVQSEVSGEAETHDSKDTDKSPSAIPRSAREPLLNNSSLNDEFPRSLENRLRTEESRATAPLTKGKTTTAVRRSSSEETLTEESHADEAPATERLPDRKSHINRFLSNDPSARQSLTGRPLTREPEVEDSRLRERSSTARPDMETANGESSSEPNTFAPSTSNSSFFNPSTSGEPRNEEYIERPEHVEDVAQLEHVEGNEQFDHDEDVEWFEHVEYADQDQDQDQDRYASRPVEESTTNNNVNSRTTSTCTRPAPRTRRRPPATAANSRLLRLPLEIRLMIYDELLSIPRRTPLLQTHREQPNTHPFHSIRQIDTELFTRRATHQRYKHSRPGIGYYDPRTMTFTVRFTDDELCTHRQWGSEHLGAITNFAPRLPRVRPRSRVGGEGASGGASSQSPTGNGNSSNNNNSGRSRSTALLYGICSPAAKRANLQTWRAVHAQLVQCTPPLFPPPPSSSSSPSSSSPSQPDSSPTPPLSAPPPYTPTASPSPSSSSSSSSESSSSTSEEPLHDPSSTAIYILELSFPRICSAINVLKALVLGRLMGWRELRRLSVLRIRIRAGAGAGVGAGRGLGEGAGDGGDGDGHGHGHGAHGEGGEEEEEEEHEGGGGPLNEVDMVALYSLALTLAEEMERKVLLRRGPWIEIAW